MATAGRVLLMSKGAWVSGTSYSPMDYVYYGGNSYVCKSASSGTTTPDNDTTHWQLMASGFDMDMITQTITNEQNKIASDAAVYAETVKLEAQDAALAADIATVETTSTASKAYSVGEYLVYNNQLYKVTSAIASGGTLTVGTNISATSAGGELTSIKDALSPWETVTNTSLTGSEYGDIYFWKVGRLVFFSYGLGSATLNQGTHIIGTLPEAFRPIATATVDIWANGATNEANITITTNGAVQVRTLTAITYMQGSGCYISAS